MKKYFLVYAALVLGLVCLFLIPFTAGFCSLPPHPDNIALALSFGGGLLMLFLWPALALAEIALIRKTIDAFSTAG